MVSDLPRDNVMASNFISHGIDVMNLPAFLRAFIGPLVPCELLTASGLLSTAARALVSVFSPHT